MATITLKQLDAFVQVADLGSFRRAAERLNTTQPNISARIAGLERQLGVSLMERDAGSVRLTPMGETLLAQARRVLRETDAFVAAAGDTTLIEGRLRLGVTEMIVHSWLGDFLKAVKSAFPNVLVDLTVDLSINLSAALFNRSIDLALQSGPFDRKTSGMIFLGSYPMVWIAAPQLGLHKGPLALDEIIAHTVLTHARGTLPFQQIAAHFAQAGVRSARLVPSTNMAACLQMTLDGLGIACLPASMVRRELATGVLQRLDYPWSPDELSFSARFDPETTAAYVGQAAGIAARISAAFKSASGAVPQDHIL